MVYLESYGFMRILAKNFRIYWNKQVSGTNLFEKKSSISEFYELNFLLARN